jgi:hypothetical protein
VRRERQDLEELKNVPVPQRRGAGKNVPALALRASSLDVRPVAVSNPQGERSCSLLQKKSAGKASSLDENEVAQG